MSTASQPEPTALDHALALARFGFRVLPIKPGLKHPPMNAWQNAATTDPVMIDSWWNGIYRNHGVGIATGHLDNGTAFFVLDIDDRETYSGSDTLHELEVTHGKLPDTITSITGSGSEHRFLRVPDGRRIPHNDQSGTIGVGLDIRGIGGQVVVAPTIHPNGRPYAWEHGRAPGRIDMAEAPAWFLDLLEPKIAEPSKERAKLPDTYSTPSSAADRYNNSVTWTELLTADGWTLDHTDGGEDYWTRPGKDKGTSGTVGWEGNDALKVFSSSSDIGWLEADKTYSKFQYYARRHHNGDESAAARAFIDLERGGTVHVLPVIPVGAPAREEEPEPVNQYDADLLAKLIDWPAFWLKDTTEARWLAEPVLAEGRAHAIYAPGGTGKSLFSLWLAATLASGRQGLDGEPVQRRRVLYLDYEMTHDDLVERLEAMAYNHTCDLSWLHYALLPSLPPADAPEGGKAIARMAQLVDAELVILDTFSRAVAGDENDADTVRAFYRWTGLHLKAEGRSFCRIDHAGKDIGKGQRGTSAKNDDVDVVWQMTKADGGFRMDAKKRRMGWVPETLALLQYDVPNLHYKIADRIAPLGTQAVVDGLDALDVPVDATFRVASNAYRAAGKTAPNETIRAAQKHRKTRVFVHGTATEQALPVQGGTAYGAVRLDLDNARSDGSEQSTEQNGTEDDAITEQGPSLERAPFRSVPPIAPDNERF